MTSEITLKPGWLREDVERASERVAMGFPTPREYRMEAMLQILRDHDGECLGDHPDWIGTIDELLRRLPSVPAAETTRDKIEAALLDSPVWRNLHHGNVIAMRCDAHDIITDICAALGD